MEGLVDGYIIPFGEFKVFIGIAKSQPPKPAKSYAKEYYGSDYRSWMDETEADTISMESTRAATMLKRKRGQEVGQ